MSEFASAYAPPRATVADVDLHGGIHDGTPHGAFLAQAWAPFWYRVAATLLDGLVLLVPSYIVSFVVARSMARSGQPILMLAMTYGATYSLAWLYQAWLLSRPRGATLGRRAVGIAVLHGARGEPIGFARAFLRAMVSSITGVFLLPPLVQLFTARRRAPSDLATGTVTVRYRESNAIVAVLVVLIGMLFLVFVVGIVAAIAIPQYQDYVNRARASQGTPR